MNKQILTVHYHRYDNKYENWTLWTWLDEKEIELTPAGKDEYGLIFKVNVADYPPAGNICMLPKYNNWEKKDDPNRCWSRTMPRELWLLQGNPTLFTEPPPTDPFVRKAFLDGPHEITVVLTNPVQKSELTVLEPEIRFENGDQIKPKMIALYYNNTDSSDIIRVKTQTRIEPDMLPAKIHLKGYKAGDLYVRGVLDSTEYLSDEPLGFFYSPQQTKFMVYAPAATSVILNLYAAPYDGEAVKHELKSGSRGVWHTTIKGNLLGKYYTYSVAGPDPYYDKNTEVIDPYVRAVTQHDGRGIITDENTAVSKGPDFMFEDAIIYEMHIRDFTISTDSGIKNKGKYLGWTENGTTLKSSHKSTGLDHLVDLGINTVQILPIQDFEFYPESGNYFWGYMPVNFNSPEGWYATKKTDDTRIREFKQLVDALHRKGIKVVLDVVYNHTSEGNPMIKYNFNGLVPNFYYRQRPDGSYWNGSGTGNEFRSENPMGRRFIVESVKYWVEEYDVDGFRFDLMGLHDIDTMREIVQTLRSIKPDVFIYGEPWTAGDTPIEPTVKGTQRGEGFSVFNDHFRDALKGPWYNIEPGFIQTGINVDKVKAGIIGSITDFANSPGESINYVAVHDGRTLWDQINASTKNLDGINMERKRAMHKLAGAILFTSQGTPFIHGGQEFLRSKKDEHNSYNLPDSINQIEWKLKEKNDDIFRYYRGLIALRKAHPVFRMRTAQQVRENLKFYEEMNMNVPDKCIAYILHRGDTNDNWKSAVVLINPNWHDVEFALPAGVWNVVVDHNNAGTGIIERNVQNKVRVAPISAMVMYNN